MNDAYTETALHFEVERLPVLLERHFPTGPLALADLGCGDGPLLRALERAGLIAPSRPVYAVDLSPTRLARVRARLPWVETIVGPAEHVPSIPDGTLDAVVSTMVLEHVPDERAFLAEIRRLLRPEGRAYVTTVFKKPWAWYFRKRDGQSVLDTSHLREYTDLDVVRELVAQSGLELVALERTSLWFPLLDPLLFRVAGRMPQLVGRRTLLRALRAPRVPVPGYFALVLVLQR